jgi:hypothetical protein
MASCREATRLISADLDRLLFWSERLTLTLHLLLCPPCARFRQAVRWLHQILASPPSDVRLPAAARERIRRALERAARDE